LEAGASVWSIRDDGSRFAAIMRAVAPKAAQISIFARVEWVIAWRRRAVSVSVPLELPGRGKRSIKRSAGAARRSRVHELKSLLFEARMAADGIAPIGVAARRQRYLQEKGRCSSTLSTTGPAGM
jgi:hypothetical protein